MQHASKIHEEMCAIHDLHIVYHLIYTTYYMLERTFLKIRSAVIIWPSLESFFECYIRSLVFYYYTM